MKTFGPSATQIITKDVSSLPTNDTTETATFAAGCFWGVELSFQRVPGVISTQVGYTAGEKDNPTYEEVCRGTTGHAEAVQLTFDPSIVSYDELLTVLWDRMDPTQVNRQGNDRGTQYRSGIYYHSEDQKIKAEESIATLQSTLDKPVATEVLPASKFWPAEDYHQQYLEKGGQCSLKGDVTGIRCYG
uniref:peptide-methionine (S)-S-oxide reductase n=2 Tax=Fibrocapsa japonica TaxID=94617 RepID=A0A7S2V8A8_9STRA|eukprot:CAMPEP_0113934886 /NCGR_PEP_ID=MMETSP1339-20121228/2138_1 /TAXON_ID=94617 /ORGANISM="Fibrocapsa japonica" /LENGTH=187 /DNA_ID=CAMNT_0000936843 /DNA_START=72 /DNA_END=635 /DNA_ORIENTATION=- /assembly_acc=CAM_ASM_000762